MSLIVGIARWRHHHVVAEDEEGMTAEEMATALKTSLPLVRIEDHSGKCMKLCVVREDAPAGSGGELVWAEVEEDGTLHSCSPPAESEDAWARGKVATWIPAILDANSRKILVGGEEDLVNDVLAQLHETLWSPSPF
jgi:hypothetical protein